MHTLRNRKGSIPLVLIIVILLGIGAAASLFSTMGNARLDKRSSLNTMAKMLAQSAVEEILIKVTNNASDFTEAERFQYSPFATRFLAEEQGFLTPQVEILGRVIEAPSDKDQETEFFELMTQGAGFASPDVRDAAFTQNGSAPDTEQDWRVEGNLPEWMKDGQMDNLFHDMLKVTVDGTEHFGMHGKGEEYHEAEWKTYQDRGTSGFQDGNAIRTSFWDLEPLAEKTWDLSNIHTECHFSDCTKVADPDNAIPTGEMKAFMDQWDKAMDAVADRVSNRIAGCAGNPNYGVGAMISALSLGGASDADSDAEEEFRETSQNGGLLDYKSFMLTVQGSAESAPGSAMRVKKSVSAHRLVARMNFKEAMDILRNSTAPYLMAHYNLTPQDLVVLGWINPLVYQESVKDSKGDPTTTPAGPSDKLAKIVVLKEILSKLSERYPDNPNPRVVPFQAATCVGAIKS